MRKGAFKGEQAVCINFEEFGNQEVFAGWRVNNCLDFSISFDVSPHF